MHAKHGVCMYLYVVSYTVECVRFYLYCKWSRAIPERCVRCTACVEMYFGLFYSNANCKFISHLHVSGHRTKHYFYGLWSMAPLCCRCITHSFTYIARFMAIIIISKMWFVARRTASLPTTHMHTNYSHTLSFTICRSTRSIYESHIYLHLFSDMQFDRTRARTRHTSGGLGLN